jgi:hypothetical protein
MVAHRIFTSRFLWAAALVVSAVAPASAAPIAGNGTLGDFTGDFSYNSVSHMVTVSLTNAATTAPGGLITGFAFNLPQQPGAVTGVTYNAVGPNGTTFALLGGASFNNSVSVSPYGDADIGAALVAIGQTGTWTFQLTGNNSILNALTAQQIYDTVTTNSQYGFLVRFKGFDGGGSDKVPGGSLGIPDPPITPTGDPSTVPEPTTLAVFGALAGFGALGYRFRRKTAAV